MRKTLYALTGVVLMALLSACGGDPPAYDSQAVSASVYDFTEKEALEECLLFESIVGADSELDGNQAVEGMTLLAEEGVTPVSTVSKFFLDSARGYRGDLTAAEMDEYAEFCYEYTGESW